jgi:hypothetical protein
MPERLHHKAELLDLIGGLYEVLRLGGHDEFMRMLKNELSLVDGNGMYKTDGEGNLAFAQSPKIARKVPLLEHPLTAEDVVFVALIEAIGLEPD